jgi:hypothetical protein
MGMVIDVSMATDPRTLAPVIEEWARDDSDDAQLTFVLHASSPEAENALKDAVHAAMREAIPSGVTRAMHTSAPDPSIKVVNSKDFYRLPEVAREA